MADDPKLVRADASPQKDFFINMITKDISLVECILDLLDNCIDGANNHIKKYEKEIDPTRRYAGYTASITFDDDHFLIKDNCGGISVERAEKYAFNFGRSKEAPHRRNESIGLYGIGMKRAIFKIGEKIEIESATEDESFSTDIDVGAWGEEDKEGKWGFDLKVGGPKELVGTEISIPKLIKEVSVALGDSAFSQELRKEIARDYALILKQGFQVEVNGRPITPIEFEIMSDGGFEGIRFKKELSSKEGSVEFEIFAGLKKSTEPDDTEMGNADVAPGWYVGCNDRIILPADTSYRTGWGTTIKKVWHSQYKPFIGFALFRSDDPRLLPWNTTKRGVDLNSSIYNQALVFMADVAALAVEYTNKRRADQDKAKELEEAASTTSIFETPVKGKIDFVVPTFLKEKPKISMSGINFRVRKSDLDKVKHALGDPSMKNGEAGKQVFEHFMDNEIEE